MGTKYTGSVVPTLNNAPANAWTTDAEKACHVGELYLVDSNGGGDAGKVYAFSEYGVGQTKTATITDGVAAFSDGGDLAMTKAEVTMSPAQNLNGYSKPWPEGYGGNIVPDTLPANTIAATFTTASTTIASATNARVAAIAVPTNTDIYIQKKTGNTTACTVALGDTGSIAVGTALYSPKGLTNVYAQTVNTGEHSWLFICSNSSAALTSLFTNSTEAEFMVSLGTTRKDYAPYKNICQITGYSSVSVTVSATNGSGGTTYNSTFTNPATVYGGTYDFVSGSLKVNRRYIDLADLTWTRRTTNKFSATLSADFDATVSISNHICDAFEVVYVTGLVSAVNQKISLYKSSSTKRNSTVYLNMAFAGIDSKTDLDTWLGNVHPHLCYVQADLQSYSLTQQTVNSLYGQNYVWSADGAMSSVQYQSNIIVIAYNWLETWTMPKITTSNGTVYVLPYPQEYTPEIYDVDAPSTGRNASGTMIRDRVARKHKFNYKWAALSQSELSEILDAIQGESFTLTTADPETGAKTNYTVYPGNRSMPVYWYPTPQSTSWMYQTLSANLIEM